MELTPEERRRIYEEEKARLEPRPEVEEGSAPQLDGDEVGPSAAFSSSAAEDSGSPAPKKGIAGKVILGLFILFVIIRFISSFSGSSSSSRSSSPSSPLSGEKTVRATYWCADSYDGAMWIAVAVRDNDAQALRGLIVRGKAFEVEKGTRMVGAGSTGGVFTGVIQSGAHIGRECYFSTNALE
jgi:hypothetical protein